MSVNREFKDSVFTLLFKEKVKMLELYNALSGNDIPTNANIEVATLEDVLFMDRLNDLAFVVNGKLVILVEHQSTICENIALRLLVYLSRVYEKILDKKSMLRSKLIKIPKPEFYVLYNGKYDFPDTKKFRLSDAFKDSEKTSGSGMLELEVTVFNVNAGYNNHIVCRSSDLSGYVAFVAKVRGYLAEGHELSDAIALAIEYCIDHGLLSEFLDKHSSEVRNMLTVEFNMEDAKMIWREEGLEEGLERGRREGEVNKANAIAAIARNMLGMGMPMDSIVSATGLALEDIGRL